MYATQGCAPARSLAASDQAASPAHLAAFTKDRCPSCRYPCSSKWTCLDENHQLQHMLRAQNGRWWLSCADLHCTPQGTAGNLCMFQRNPLKLVHLLLAMVGTNAMRLPSRRCCLLHARMSAALVKMGISNFCFFSGGGAMAAQPTPCSCSRNVQAPIGARCCNEAMSTSSNPSHLPICSRWVD